MSQGRHVSDQHLRQHVQCQHQTIIVVAPRQLPQYHVFLEVKATFAFGFKISGLEHDMW